MRDGNEDRSVIREQRDTLLLAVADGVGGSAGGEVAADAAVVALADRFFDAPRERTLEDRLTDAIRDANTAVLKAAESSGNTQAASTLVAAVVRRDHLVVANLGDSRAYLVRDGAPRQLTEDHSGDLQHAITRFVGDPRGVQPDVYVEELRPADRLVLCSDGLTRHVSADEIGEVVAATADLESAAVALVDMANARGGEDNVTVVLYAARDRSGLPRPSRRALAFGIFVALVIVVVLGAFAVLFSVAPLSPR
ncbi:MAG TPA: protein phosphatase 2C domain-containing protein [Candidatus Limnocylindria bacterium]|nr:protein phosphatase 2C domain-containing protein [Candidatus Limnocylindria bacterium]